MVDSTLLASLPALNACLNGIAAVLLFAGRSAIRRGNVARHKRLMLAACLISLLFLASYLTAHYLRPEPTRYVGAPIMRMTYLLILIPHTLLAASLLPLVPMLLVTAWRERFTLHQKMARWIWPIWIFVSITGILIYLMLYVLPKGTP